MQLPAALKDLAVNIGTRLVTSREWLCTRSTLGYTSKISETVGLSQNPTFTHTHNCNWNQHSHSSLADLVFLLIGVLVNTLEKTVGVHSCWVPDCRYCFSRGFCEMVEQ